MNFGAVPDYFGNSRSVTENRGRGRGRGRGGGDTGNRGGRGRGRGRGGGKSGGMICIPRPTSEWTKLVMDDFDSAVYPGMEYIDGAATRHDLVFIDVQQITSRMLEGCGEECCDEGSLSREYFDVLFDTVTKMIEEFPAKNIYLGLNGQCPYAKLHVARRGVFERISEGRNVTTTFLHHHPENSSNMSMWFIERVEDMHNRGVAPWAKANVYVDVQWNPGTSLFKFSRFVHEGLESGLLKHGLSLVIISSAYSMISMALAIHQPNIYVVRNYDNKKRMQVVSVKKIREIIAKTYTNCERAIDDFLFLTFLTGSTFAPGIAEFQDVKTCYLRVKTAHPNKWLVNDAQMDRETMELLLQELVKDHVRKEGAVDLNVDDAKSVIAGYDWQTTYLCAGCPDWRWYCTAMDKVPSVKSLLACIKIYRRNFDRKATMLKHLAQLMLMNGMRNRKDMPHAFKEVARNANYKKYFEPGPDGTVYDMIPDLAERLYDAIESRIEKKVREIQNICERYQITRTGTIREKVDPYKHTPFKSSDKPITQKTDDTEENRCTKKPISDEDDEEENQTKKQDEYTSMIVRHTYPSGRTEAETTLTLPDGSLMAVSKIFQDYGTNDNENSPSDGENDEEYDDDRSDSMDGEYDD